MEIIPYSSVCVLMGCRGMLHISGFELCDNSPSSSSFNSFSSISSSSSLEKKKIVKRLYNKLLKSYELSFVSRQLKPVMSTHNTNNIEDCFKMYV